MILDTGVRCSDTLTIGTFPFGVGEDYKELFNFRGFSGPVKTGIIDDLTNQKTFSGVLGDGTFYPYAAKLDQLSRTFWCVKKWTMSVSYTRSSNASTITCTSAFPLPGYAPFLDATQYCIIGGYGGSPTNLFATDLVSKALNLQDYCSDNSDAYNRNIPGICPIIEAQGNENRNTCVPINPIQKFNDLLSRNNYFTWAPTEEEIGIFETGKSFTGLKGPYFNTWDQYAVVEPIEIVELGYDCGITPFIEKATSYFTLSLMDLDGLAYSGLSRFYQSGYYPELNEERPFDKFGKSGECLTNKWGEVTGYGINKKPSGLWSPLVYNIGTGINYSSFATPDNSSIFYPFFHFQMRFKNLTSSTRACPINDTITSVYYTGVGLQKIGNFRLYDTISNNTITGREASVILDVPLYSRRNFTLSNIVIDMTAQEFWVDNTGKATY